MTHPKKISLSTMHELTNPQLTVGELITDTAPNSDKVRHDLEHWRSTYAMTYQYDDPNKFTRPELFNQLPSIQNPSSKCVQSYKFHPDYIPKLMYCRPPGHIHNAPQALGLGTFNKVQLEKNVKMKPIQRGPVPQLKREVAFSPGYRHLASNMTKEEEAKFMYHNLVKPNRNEGLDLSTKNDDFTYDKLKKDDFIKLQKIYHPAVWTTNTERSHLQAAIPMKNKRKVGTDLEISSNNIKYKAMRYNANSEPWQTFSNKWDRVQARHAIPDQEDEIAEKVGGLSLKKEARKSSTGHNASKQVVRQVPAAIEKVDLVPHSENRQLPCYSGYVPRLPITKKSRNLTSKCQNDESATPPPRPGNGHFITSMQRAFPKYSMSQKSSYARRPKMSSMVTLVHPHNPFRLAKDEGRIIWNIKQGAGTFEQEKLF